MLILDEPTSGVDPLARDRFWQLLIHLSRNEGVTFSLYTELTVQQNLSLLAGERGAAWRAPLQDPQRRCIDPMPVAHMGRVTVAVADEEMRTIGITAVQERELLAVRSAQLPANHGRAARTRRHHLDHQQCFADFAAMFQKKFVEHLVLLGDLEAGLETAALCRSKSIVQ
jgi:hypothetical protein